MTQATLIAHCGATKVTLEELRRIPTPDATATYRPIPHVELIETIQTRLDRYGISIQRQEYAVQHGGTRLFGVMDLVYGMDAERTAAIGIRTSNDRSMALEIAVGMRVFVCDNLAFSGDMIALRRKHTAKLDLGESISLAMDRFFDRFAALEAGVAALKALAIPDDRAKALIHDAFAGGLLPVRLFKAVSQMYFHPQADWPDVRPRTAWGLCSAFTRAIRGLEPARAFKATAGVGRMFGLGHRNGIEPASPAASPTEP